MISKKCQQKSTPQTENSQEVSKYYFKDSKYEGIASKFIERKTKKEEASLKSVTKNSKINDFINKKLKKLMILFVQMLKTVSVKLNLQAEK